MNLLTYFLEDPVGFQVLQKKEQIKRFHGCTTQIVTFEYKKQQEQQHRWSQGACEPEDSQIADIASC